MAHSNNNHIELAHSKETSQMHFHLPHIMWEVELERNSEKCPLY